MEDATVGLLTPGTDSGEGARESKLAFVFFYFVNQIILASLVYLAEKELVGLLLLGSRPTEEPDRKIPLKVWSMRSLAFHAHLPGYIELRRDCKHKDQRADPHGGCLWLFVLPVPATCLTPSQGLSLSTSSHPAQMATSEIK